MTDIPQDIANVTVSGLEKAAFVDKVTAGGPTNAAPASKPITFTSETDRVYTSPASEPITVLENGKPRLQILRDSLGEAVVWNPWDKKAGGMADFGPADGWKKMVCVEAGSVGSWNTVEAGDTWEGGQRIKAL